MTLLWGGTTTFIIPDLSSDRVSDTCLIAIEIRVRQSVRKPTCLNGLFFITPCFQPMVQPALDKFRRFQNTPKRYSA